MRLRTKLSLAALTLALVAATSAFGLNPSASAQGGDTNAPATTSDLAGVTLAAAIASPTAHQSFAVGQSITLDASASSGPITQYIWEIPVLGTQITSVPTLNVSFSRHGTFWVRLRVTDGATFSRWIGVPVLIRNKILVVAMGSAGVLSDLAGQDYSGGQTTLKCVDTLYNAAPTVTYPDQGHGIGSVSYYSFATAASWLTREFRTQRPGFPDSPADVTVRPTPITITDTPPVRLGSDPACASIGEPYFSAKAIAAGEDLSAYNTVAYVYLHRDDEPSPFYSCAGTTTGSTLPNRAYVDYMISFHSNGTGQCTVEGGGNGTQVLVHELTHTFGAADAYNSFACLDPEGIPDPNKLPKYPQSDACIMCGHTADDSSNSGAEPVGSTKFDHLLVCDAAARDNSWTHGCNNDGVCRSEPSLGLYESHSTCPADCP